MPDSLPTEEGKDKACEMLDASWYELLFVVDLEQGGHVWHWGLGPCPAATP
jgi:hypothetical protein